MRAVLAFLLLLPAPVLSDDARLRSWGLPLEGSGPSVVSVAPCPAPCAAVVRFDNTLVVNGRGGPVGTMRATLALGGVAIGVAVEHGGGLQPDLLQVRPPPGYAAEPAEVLVDDDASAVVRVVPVPTT